MTSRKQIVPIARVPKAGPYSHVVRVGDLLFVSGQGGIDPSTGQTAGPTFTAQCRQALTNLRTILEEAGSGLPFVVKTTCFVTDPTAFADLNTIFAEYFPADPPTRAVPVVALPKGLLFSIEVIAVTAS